MEFAVEQWNDVKDEALPLLLKHWEEIATDKEAIPLSIDYESYDALAKSGALHIVVARKDGKMAGYWAGIVKPHLHYNRTLFAFTDLFFLLPEHRKGMAGVKLFRVVEETLRQRGVEKIFAATKTRIDIGPIFRRLGYGVHEIVYSKRLT